jgi:hypothetical protein
MQALLNRDEIVLELANKILTQFLKKHHTPTWARTEEYLEKCHFRFLKTQMIAVDFNIVNDCIKQDLQASKDQFKLEYKSKYRRLVGWLADNFDRLDLDPQYLVDLCISGRQQSFVKTVAQQLDSKVKYRVHSNKLKPTQPVLVRNIIHNEALLRQRMADQQPFWFIDTGYTNFLTGRKTWHRLVKNHIHHAVPDRVYPADRLSLLESFPWPWRTGGSKILVVENSAKHFELDGRHLAHWRNRVKYALEEYTDRPIEFRGKNPDRKTRDNLYELLCANDYYCVITDASAAAVEAIWAGIPVVTLNTHITTPVARSNLADINDLYRGDLGNWLCALSYHQFTKEEMFNGTAVNLMQEFYNV